MKLYLPLLLTVLLTSTPLLQARLGDSPSDVQRRIVSSNLGREYPRDRLNSKWQQLPISGLLDGYQQITGDKFDYGAFWKAADNKRVGNTALRDDPHPAGWDLHVVYKGGRSVLEAYRRNGAELNQFEINGLLSLHRGDSHWEEVERGTPSAIGVTYQRADGLFRANVRRDRSGSYLIVYLTSMDNELIRIRDEIRKQTEEEQSRTVDDSLAGF